MKLTRREGAANVMRPGIYVEDRIAKSGMSDGSFEECSRAESQLAEIATVRDRIDQQQRNFAELQERLWSRLWQMPINIGDE